MFHRVVIVSLIVGFSPLAWPQIKIQAVVNAASFQPDIPRGGALASIFVSGLVGSPGLITASSNLPLPFQLAGVNVIVNGSFAPILAVYIPSPSQDSFGQINIQMPLERNAFPQPPDGSISVFQAQNPCNCDDKVTPLANSGWGGFFSDRNGYAIAMHADYSLVTTQNPAHAGEIISAYADGFFSVWPPPPIAFPVPQQPLFSAADSGTGYLFLQDPPKTILKLPGTAGGSCANTPAIQVRFEGLAPNLVGVEQINFVIPANQQPGDWTLFFNIGTSSDGRNCNTVQGSSSSPLVKLPVR